MAFTKKTWKARTGTGLNKYRINGQVVTLANVPDEVVQAGDVATAETMNDLEQRIYDADTQMDTDTSNDTTARANEDSRIRNVLVGSFLVVDSFSASGSGYYLTMDIRKSGYTAIGIVSAQTGLTGYFHGLRSAEIQNYGTEAIVWFSDNSSHSVTVKVLYRKNGV